MDDTRDNIRETIARDGTDEAIRKLGRPVRICIEKISNDRRIPRWLRLAALETIVDTCRQYGLVIRSEQSDEG